MGSSRRKTGKHQYTVNCSGTARNLRKNELAGVIFGCKNSTIKECKTNNLFGLPPQHFAYVKKITPGMILFLFNYTDRKLHGIYEAVSSGQMNINPRGWTKNDEEYTEYPAQVRVRALNLCPPLTEQEYFPILADNYYKPPKLFWLELDQTQTDNLIELFQARSAMPVSKIPDHHGVKAEVPVSEDTSTTPDEVWENAADAFEPESSRSNESVVTVPQTSWISLFKDSRVPNEPVLETSELVPSPDDHQTSELYLPLSRNTEDHRFVVDDAIDMDNYPRACEAAGSSVTYQESGSSVLETSELVPSPDDPFELYLPLSGNTEDHGFVVDDAMDINNYLRTCEAAGSSVIYQLTQEIVRLKISELEKDVKISFLEQQLAQSKLDKFKQRKQNWMFSSGQTL